MEREALTKMEVASEKITREYKKIKKMVQSDLDSDQKIQILKESGITGEIHRRLLSLMKK